MKMHKLGCYSEGSERHHRSPVADSWSRYPKVQRDTTIHNLNNLRLFDRIMHVDNIHLKLASTLLSTVFSLLCTVYLLCRWLLCNLNPCETEPVFAPQKSLTCGCPFPAVNVALEHTSVHTVPCPAAGRSRDPFELKVYRVIFVFSFAAMSSNTTVKNASPVCTE